uniref:Uncharacterized protein n=1 Tax=Romanomermis culicivorax TaxID=13658 RepID=A0A915K704_ROMCU
MLITLTGFKIHNCRIAIELIDAAVQRSAECRKCFEHFLPGTEISDRKVVDVLDISSEEIDEKVMINDKGGGGAQSFFQKPINSMNDFSRMT